MLAWGEQLDEIESSDSRDTSVVNNPQGTCLNQGFAITNTNAHALLRAFGFALQVSFRSEKTGMHWMYAQRLMSYFIPPGSAPGWLLDL